jgi:hypothetical protein
MEEQPPILSYTNDMKNRGTVPCYRSGNYVVTGQEADFPERCIVCGSDQKCKVVERQFETRASFQYSAKVTIRMFYCEKHLSTVTTAKKMLALLAIILIVVLTFVAVILRRVSLPRDMESSIGWMAIGAIFVSAVIAGPIVVTKNRGLAFRKRKQGAYYFSGAHRKVLEVLPEWPGR